MKIVKVLKGFSIIELMIVLVIVALLVALAIPGYSRYIRKANRTEAMQLMLQYSNNQEIWRANAALYATSDQLTPPNHDHYDFYTRATGATCEDQAPNAIEFTVVACGKNDQVNDKEGITSCTNVTVNQAGAKTPVECW